MEIIWFLVLISLTGINTSNTPSILSEVECDKGLFKCWRDISHPELPNSDVRLTVTYLHLSGEETLFFAKLTSIGQVAPSEYALIREDFELTFDASNLDLSNVVADIHSTSEILTPSNFRCLFFKSISNKKQTKFIETCPVFLFTGSGTKLGFCMTVSISNDGITVDKTDRNLDKNVAPYY